MEPRGSRPTGIARSSNRASACGPPKRRCAALRRDRPGTSSAAPTSGLGDTRPAPADAARRAARMPGGTPPAATSNLLPPARLKRRDRSRPPARPWSGRRPGRRSVSGNRRACQGGRRGAKAHPVRVAAEPDGERSVEGARWRGPGREGTVERARWRESGRKVRRKTHGPESPAERTRPQSARPERARAERRWSGPERGRAAPRAGTGRTGPEQPDGWPQRGGARQAASGGGPIRPVWWIRTRRGGPPPSRSTRSQSRAPRSR